MTNGVRKSLQELGLDEGRVFGCSVKETFTGIRMTFRPHLITGTWRGKVVIGQLSYRRLRITELWQQQYQVGYVPIVCHKTGTCWTYGCWEKKICRGSTSYSQKGSRSWSKNQFAWLAVTLYSRAMDKAPLSIDDTWINLKLWIKQL